MLVMPTHRLEYTDETCPGCSNGSEHRLVRIVETWNPFPGEESPKDVVFLKCPRSDCGYEVMVEDYLFDRETPYVRPKEERFTPEDLKLMHGYHEAVSNLDQRNKVVVELVGSHCAVAA